MKTLQINQENEVLTDDEVTVTEQGGRYRFAVEGTAHPHSISSDPSITSPERLKAHTASVKASHRKGELTQGDFSAVELQEALKHAKNIARKDCDMLSSENQILAIGADGERLDACDYGHVAFVERVSKKLIDRLFAEYPEATKLIIESEGYWIDSTLPTSCRYDEREVSGDYSQLSVFRAS